MTADDIVWLKDTLVADASAVGQKEERKHTKGLTVKAYREGAAQLRPGVTRADVRDAQVMLPLPSAQSARPPMYPSMASSLAHSTAACPGPHGPHVCAYLLAQVRLRYELEEKYARITDCFKYIDADRTGHLERHEVKRLLEEFNIVGVSDAAIESLIDFADTDGDGEINYREFARGKTPSAACRLTPAARRPPSPPPCAATLHLLMRSGSPPRLATAVLTSDDLFTGAHGL